jgi:hypothetical protein
METQTDNIKRITELRMYEKQLNDLFDTISTFQLELTDQLLTIACNGEVEVIDYLAEGNFHEIMEDVVKSNLLIKDIYDIACNLHELILPNIIHEVEEEIHEEILYLKEELKDKFIDEQILP